MKTYNEIKDNAIERDKIYRHLRIKRREETELCEEKIERLKRKITRIEEKYNTEMEKNGNWIQFFIIPLAEALHQAMNPEWKYEILGPFGLRLNVAIHFFLKTKNEIEAVIGDRDKAYDLYFAPENFKGSINIIPVDIKKGIYHYETGEIISKFSPGTIGELSGMNNVTAEITSLKQLIGNIRRSVIYDRGREGRKANSHTVYR